MSPLSRVLVSMVGLAILLAVAAFVAAAGGRFSLTVSFAIAAAGSLLTASILYVGRRPRS